VGERFLCFAEHPSGLVAGLHWQHFSYIRPQKSSCVRHTCLHASALSKISHRFCVIDARGTSQMKRHVCNHLLCGYFTGEEKPCILAPSVTQMSLHVQLHLFRIQSTALLATAFPTWSSIITFLFLSLKVQPYSQCFWAISSAYMDNSSSPSHLLFQTVTTSQLSCLVT
jgi:hypothetical protein